MSVHTSPNILIAFLRFYLTHRAGSLLVLAYVISTTLLRAKENGLNRLCGFFFPFFLAITMTLYLISDAKSGNMSHAGTISPAIFWLAIIAVTQEAAFVDNLILISFTALDTFIATQALNAFYPIAEIHQYYILGAIYFFSALFLHNLFHTFFCQERYIETRNKELSAQAIYDPLTYLRIELICGLSKKIAYQQQDDGSRHVRYRFLQAL